jgi:hypothetical protein
MTEHLLYLESADDWGPSWWMECRHGPSPKWNQYTYEGVVHVDEQCWLQSWWENLGSELLKLKFAKDAQPTFPLAVRPSDDWDENGGTLVVEPTQHMVGRLEVAHGCPWCQCAPESKPQL